MFFKLFIEFKITMVKLVISNFSTTLKAYSIFYTKFFNAIHTFFFFYNSIPSYFNAIQYHFYVDANIEKCNNSNNSLIE